MTLNKRGFAITVFLGIILLSTPVTTDTFAQKSENKIPKWVKNNASWWADGSIDGASFIQGVEFLIKEGIPFTPAFLMSLLIMGYFFLVSRLSMESLVSSLF